MPSTRHNSYTTAGRCPQLPAGAPASCPAKQSWHQHLSRRRRRLTCPPEIAKVLVAAFGYIGGLKHFYQGPPPQLLSQEEDCAGTTHAAACRTRRRWWQLQAPFHLGRCSAGELHHVPTMAMRGASSRSCSAWATITGHASRSRAPLSFDVVKVLAS